MVQEQNPKADLNIGCSNITQLQRSSPGSIPVSRQYQRRPYYTPNELKPEAVHEAGEDYQLNQRRFNSVVGSQPQQTHPHQQSTLLHSYTVIDSLNKSFLPGLGLGVLVTSVLVLIWGATRIRQTGAAMVEEEAAAGGATTASAATAAACTTTITTVGRALRRRPPAMRPRIT